VKHFLVLVACCVFSSITVAQTASEWLAGLPQIKDYVQKRASSYDRSGGNADYRKIAPGDTLVLMDEAGPGEITHFWTTMWADGQALKALVLRMYWDEEKTPSVESPLGDFFRARARRLRNLRISAASSGAQPSVEYIFFRCRFRSMHASL